MGTSGGMSWDTKEKDRRRRTERGSGVPSQPPLAALLGCHTSIGNSSGSKQPRPDTTSEVQAKVPQFPQWIREEVDWGLLSLILGLSLTIPL